jgi:hypothetical protein
MVHGKPRLLFSYGFFARKFLKIMYLNGSPRSVDLKEQFIVTQKTRHCFEDSAATVGRATVDMRRIGGV